MNLILFTILLVELLSVVDDTDSQACVKPALKNPGNPTPCLPTCANVKGKKQKKKCSAKTKCKCDKECGFSCIKHKKNCDPPPEVEGATFVVYRKNNVVKSRFMLYDKVVYNCQPGYIAVDTLPRLCVPDRGWTGSTICARDCGMRDLAGITLHNMTCGIPCVQNSDCAGDHTCICDGPCARTCVDPDMSCPNVTDPDNGMVEYTGEGLSRIAHYLCNDGFYPFSGSESRKCTGGGTWTGQPTVCAAVTCGDPLDTIESMGGAIVDWQPVYSYHSGDVLEFHCGGGRRLIGSRQRTCRSSGLWSGPATVCDVEDGNTRRCPHPGVPVNGRIVYSRGNFEVGSVVKFECDAGYVLFGESIQECLFFRQWSGDGAPKCKDPRYTDGAANIIAKLGQITKNMKTKKGKSNSPSLGRFIRRDDGHGHEIFFAFDMSESMDKDSLDNSVLFAKKLVDRLSDERTGAKNEVKYGILAFATKQKLLLDLNSVDSSPASAKRILDKMYNESPTYRNEIKKHILGGTDTKAALERVNEQIAWSHANNTRKLVKRHVFILSDGKHNIGGVPGEKVREMQRMYNTAGGPDIIEFYSITTCRECKLGATRRAKEAMDELQSLTGGKPENFIFIRNFYELNTLLDSVTDAKSDFSICGQAGEVGSVKRQAQVVRVLGGTKASDRAWPWQALITNIDDNNDVVKTYEDNVIGGGSLIDNKWVLTAAHLFDDTDAGGSVLVTLGMNERPTTNEKFDIYNTQVFLSNKIIKHPDYMSKTKSDQLRKRYTFENDIALIKLGDKRGNDNGIWFSKPSGGWVNYTDYIRPVCLPCDTSSCVRNASLTREAALINEQLDNDEQCDIEENWLLQTGNADKSIMAVVTGFGYTKPRVHGQTNSRVTDEDNSTLARNLQEGLINLLDHEECENWLTRGHFNKWFGANEELEDISERVATNMICAVSGISGNRTVDACQGDSGGPVVRRVKNPETEETCWVQIGLVSFGYGCGQKNEEYGAYPGYYTNVARFIPWIRNEMNNN